MQSIKSKIESIYPDLSPNDLLNLSTIEHSKQRFSIGSKNDLSGWLIIHKYINVNNFFATVGDWRTGDQHKISSDIDKLCYDQYDNAYVDLGPFFERYGIKTQKQIREQEERIKEKKKFKEASSSYSNGTNEIHPYFKLKKNSLYTFNNLLNEIRTIKNADQNLIGIANEVSFIPMVGVDWEVKCFQRIFWSDEQNKYLKRYTNSSGGNFVPINIDKFPNGIILCEGVATGLTISEIVHDRTVICCMDCGNIEKVLIQIIEKKYPIDKIILFPDNDHSSIRNIGIEKAEYIKEKYNINFISPQSFDKCSDFNDMKNIRGMEYTKEYVLNKIDNLTCEEEIEFEKIEEIDMPEPRGIGKKLYNEMLEMSVVRNYNMAKLSCLTIGSTIASNIYYCKGGLNPSIYSLFVDTSGTGKTMLIVSPAKILFYQMGYNRLLSCMKPKGASAYMDSIGTETNVRYTIMDECASLIKSAHSGSNDANAKDVSELMRNIYDVNYNFPLFDGLPRRTKDPAKGSSKTDWEGKCYNPCMPLSFVMTEDQAKNSITESHIKEGLLARFIYHVNYIPKKNEKNDVEYTPEVFSNELVNELKSIFEKREILPFEKTKESSSTENGVFTKKPMKTNKFLLKKPVLTRMEITSKSWIRIKEIDKEIDDLFDATNNTKNAIMARTSQNLLKVAMIDAMFMGRDFIDVDSIEWAYQVSKYSYQSALKLLNLTDGDQYSHKIEFDKSKVLNFIKESFLKSSKPIPRYLIARKFQGMNDRQLNDILFSLTSSLCIKPNDPKKGSSYSYLRSF